MDKRKQSVAKAKTSGLYEGWMKKQGGFVKTFNKRYCVLNPKILYYYKEENVSLLSLNSPHKTNR